MSDESTANQGADKKTRRILSAACWILMSLAILIVIALTAYQGWSSPSSPRTLILPQDKHQARLMGNFVCAGQSIFVGLFALLLYRRLRSTGQKGKTLWGYWLLLNLALALALFAVFCISCAANVNWNAFI